MADQIRTSLLATNNPNHVNLEDVADSVRQSLLAQNQANSVDIDGLATSIRKNLLAKNTGDDSPLGTNLILNGTSVFVGVSNLDITAGIIRGILLMKDKIFREESRLQEFYGPNISLNESNRTTGLITEAAFYNNIGYNTYYYFNNPVAQQNYNPTTNAGHEILINHQADGFQEMLAASLPGTKIVRAAGTNSTPADIVKQNNGLYLGLATEKILKPVDGEPGTALSMVANSDTSDAIERLFNKQQRGVHNIINTIKNSNLSIAKNYDSQGSTKFIIGYDTDGQPRLSRKRFSIRNPRRNTEGDALIFSITNYAISDAFSENTLYLPPYIKSISDNDGVTWNETQFLGRPSPLYTYGNSKSDGTIEFFVLSDYAQSVDIGYDYSKDEVPAMNMQFPKSFSNGFKEELAEIERIKAERIRIETERAELIAQKALAISGETATAEVDEKIEKLNKRINRLDLHQDALGLNKLENFTPYSETRSMRSVYDGITMNDPNYKSIYGDISTTLQETQVKLQEMRDKLQFQPAFFSGDKLDFRERKKFLQKCTKPARNSEGSGFAFTKPPICHIRIGDWFNHDVVINSINYNYDNAPWTLDGTGQVQPMYMTVTMNFNIISEWYNQDKPKNLVNMMPLATDNTGFFGGNSRSNK